MQRKPEIALLAPQWRAPNTIRAFFTYRSGGLSTGPYGALDGLNGLNLGRHAGDNPHNVRANRRLLSSFLPSEPRWLRQVHSTRVLEADQVECEPDADASFTLKENIVCVVMTADCVPVLLCDVHGKIVAAAHAGWKGLANGVLQNTVNAMREHVGDTKRDIIAWIGPHIRQEHFQVQQDVVDIYQASNLKNVAGAAIIKNGAGYQLNLALFVKEALRQVGVDNVSDCQLDTYADAEKFYSYRRDRVTGRHAAIIYRI